MQKIIHRAKERGMTKTDWLESYHTFSFAGYYNPERLRFGTLRVLNDDTVKPGSGFDLHPHGDMEIISIPLEGGLIHKDSKGNSETINAGSVQVMTAGTGIMHSEFNVSESQEVKFLQVWILPDNKDAAPTYKTCEFPFDEVENDFLTFISPNGKDHTLNINQNAWISFGRFKQDESAVYSLKCKNNGVYIFVKDGKINVDGDVLNPRDGIGLDGEKEVPLVFEKDSELFVFEIPM